ncbi:hypothetical protein Tco_0195047 [Tanacetum coccineum]
MAKDDLILTTMRYISKNEVVQKYGAILPDTLTNQVMKESVAYKTYYDFTTRKVIPKPKYVRPSTRENTDQAHKASPSKRLKATTKISWKSSDKDDDDEVRMSKDDDDNADNEDDDDQDDDNEQTKSDNDDDDFVYPKLSTFDKEERHEEKLDEKEEGSDQRNHTPFHFESTDDEAYDEVTQGDNAEEEKLDEEKTTEEEEVNKMYNDVNVNLEGRDTEMTDALLANMLNPNPDTCIDSILNLNIKSTSLVDVPVTTNDEIPPSSFEDRVKSLEDDLSEFKQTNLFAEAVSLIPGIVNKYLANNMNEDVKAVKIIKEQVKVQVKEQVSKILPRIEKSVSEQLEAEVLIRSSNEAKTSHAVAANLSELELKKILIDKMENNKSIDRSVQQKTLYKALVDAYETDKDILATYGDTVTFKRRRDDEDEDEEPSAGSNRGSKRRRAGKEPESTSAPKEKTSKSTGKSKEGSKSHQKSTGQSAQAEEPIHTVEDLEEPAHQEFDTGFTEDQPVDETTQLPDWFQKPTKPPTPDRDWNKTLPAVHGPIQPWISTLARNEDPRESFNELMDTPLDFSAFVLNRLKVDTLTPELLAGPTFKLMKGSCKSLVELESFLEEVCKATTDQLEWNNPEGKQYPHDLRKTIPLIPNSRVTKTKAAGYGHIIWIKDLVSTVDPTSIDQIP